MAAGKGAALAALLALCTSWAFVGCGPGAHVRGTIVPPPGKSMQEDASASESAVLWIVPEGDATKSATGGRRVTVRAMPEGFEPEVVVVPVGTHLRITNRDQLYHTPFSVSSAARFRLEPIGPGQSGEVVLSQPGEVRLFCELHSDATGVVLVVPTSEYVRPDSRGRFSLSNLPHGTHTLAYWHPIWGEGKLPVDVPVKGSVRLDVHF